MQQLNTSDTDRCCSRWTAESHQHVKLEWSARCVIDLRMLLALLAKLDLPCCHVSQQRQQSLAAHRDWCATATVACQ